jgi:VCBS repeat-containing protein
MLKVNFGGERITESEPGTISSAAPVASGPGASLGLQIGQPLQSGAADLIALYPDLSRHEVPLTNAFDQTQVTAIYYSGVDGGITARPAEPVFPLERYNAKVDGLILRGVGFRGGTYTDELDVIPLTSAATTENSRGHPGFYSDFYYPIQNWATNYYDSIDGTANWLMITPAQYKSNSLASSTGTMRKYQEMDFRLYYLDQEWPNSSDTILKAAAVSAAPDIISTNALSGTNSLQFQVEVIADPAAEVQDVWVTFTSGQGEWHGIWQSLDLQQNTSNPLVWEGDLPLPGGITPDDVHYIVQAANGAGLVSLVDPNLPAATGVPEIQTELLPTQILLDSVNATGYYNQSGLVTATLMTNSGQPIQERTVVFAVSDSQGQIVLVQPAITNFEGKASLQALTLPVGVYSLTVYYGSTVNLTGEVVDLTDNTYLGSSASGTISLENSPVAAMDDAYTLQEEEVFNVPAPGVLDNDFDLEGDPLTALLASSPSNGQLALNPDGSFSYTPNKDYYGSDSFSYTASDGILASTPATVTLTITNVEDAPVPSSDSATTAEDTPVVINVLDNDLDADNQPLTVTAVGAPANGTAVTDGSSVTYTPDPDFSGTDQFEYTISDGSLSVTSTVALTITPVNDNPICTNAAPDTGIWIWPPDNNTFVPVHILGVVDPEGDPVTITITGIHQDERVKTGGFSPDAMGVGTDTAMVRAERDGNGDGRVYHIFFTASDGNGGTCDTVDKVRVGVFDNQSGGGLDPIDGGALYDSTDSQGSANIQGDETAMQQPYALSLAISGPLASAFAIMRRRKAA